MTSAHVGHLSDLFCLLESRIKFTALQKEVITPTLLTPRHQIKVFDGWTGSDYHGTVPTLPPTTSDVSVAREKALSCSGASLEKNHTKGEQARSDF